MTHLMSFHSHISQDHTLLFCVFVCIYHFVGTKSPRNNRNTEKSVEGHFAGPHMEISSYIQFFLEKTKCSKWLLVTKVKGQGQVKVFLRLKVSVRSRSRFSFTKTHY